MFNINRYGELNNQAQNCLAVWIIIQILISQNNIGLSNVTRHGHAKLNNIWKFIYS